MRVGTKLATGLVAGVLAGGTLTVGAVAEAAPPPEPGQQMDQQIDQQAPEQQQAPVQQAPAQQEAPDQQQAPVQQQQPGQQPQEEEEEGHGPGALIVGPEGAARAMDRLLSRDEERTRWCHGTVLPTNGLNVRTGPGIHYPRVGTLAHGSQVWTDWDTIQRRDGYLWVRMSPNRWIADYKLGNGNGKWYVRYYNC
ncbi:hypothetical protein [Actinomadura chokoriensis]|uniref:SH3 domain-containing protein n=1 Tax=Actinomadura chokoriensis TaxID=454156 RepID=A0ABV4R8B6_9ACTN